MSVSHSADLLDARRIRAGLTEDRSVALQSIDVLRETDSTNRHVERLLADGASLPLACFAESQTAGRGRNGRAWASPYARNLYLSIARHMPGPPAVVSAASLAIGLAVAEALEAIGAVGIALKWPNDLLWNERKLGGILCELVPRRGDGTTLIVGIGVNVDMTREEGVGIDQPWVSLATVLGDMPSRNEVAGRVLDHVLDALEVYERSGFAPFRERWADRDATRGRRVTLSGAGETRAGEALGIDDTGAMLLDTGGATERVVSGDLSLRSVP